MFGLKKAFVKVDSHHMAVYGLSSTGMVHIWSNSRPMALCGRRIEQRLKYSKMVRAKVICKSCEKSNKGRYALFDLLPTLTVASIAMGIISAIKVVPAKPLAEEEKVTDEGQDNKLP